MGVNQKRFWEHKIFLIVTATNQYLLQCRGEESDDSVKIRIVLLLSTPVVRGTAHDAIQGRSSVKFIKTVYQHCDGYFHLSVINSKTHYLVS